MDEDTLYPLLNNIRAVKKQDEVKKIREICKISSQGHRFVMKNCQPDLYEFQLAGLFGLFCSEFDVQDLAYGSICGGGKNASYLHYMRNEDKLEDG